MGFNNNAEDYPSAYEVQKKQTTQQATTSSKCKVHGVQKRQGAIRKSSPPQVTRQKTYSELITTAIEQSAAQMLTLNDIYNWLIENEARFRCRAGRHSSAGWKNSVRFTLSTSGRFQRTPIDGKMGYWSLSTTKADVAGPSTSKPKPLAITAAVAKDQISTVDKAPSPTTVAKVEQIGANQEVRHEMDWAQLHEAETLINALIGVAQSKIAPTCIPVDDDQSAFDDDVTPDDDNDDVIGSHSCPLMEPGLIEEAMSNPYLNDVLREELTLSFDLNH